MILLFDEIKELVKAMPWPAHIKDKTGNYVYSNNLNTRFFGEIVDAESKITDEKGEIIREDHLIGQNIDMLRARLSWTSEFVDAIRAADDTVLKGESIKLEDQVVFDIHGCIHIEDMTKLPLFNDGEDKCPKGVLTLVHDKTGEKTLLEMFDYYQKYVPERQERVHPFLTQFSLADYFITEPPEKKLRCLLHMTINGSYKSLSDKMCLSIKTIESYVAYLKQIINLDLSKLLEIMRKCQTKIRN